METENNSFSIRNHISGVMISMLALSAVDHAFEPWSNQRHWNGICCFSTKHTTL